MKPIELARRGGGACVRWLMAVGMPLLTGCEPSGSTGLERADLAEQPAEAASAWESVDLEIARSYHAAVALGDESVVVCGGARTTPAGALESLKSCERLAPGESAWSRSTDMPEARRLLTLTELDGPDSMLVVGGLVGEALAPGARAGSRGQWGALETVDGRSNHTSSRLRDGSVLVVGGTNPFLEAALTDAELRSPSGEWTSVGGERRFAHAAEVLASEDAVLVSGGNDGTAAGAATATAAIYARGPGWRSVAPMRQARRYHTLTRLDDGSVLAVGGLGLDGRPVPVAERYHPEQDRWTVAKPPRVPRFAHGAARLGRYVVIAGGHAGDARMTGEVEVYDPVSDTWAKLWPLREPRAYLTLTPFGPQRLLVVGGTDLAREYSTAEVVAPSALGIACTTDEECVSGHCVDDRCCESACEGTCRYCGGTSGVCEEVDGPPRRAEACDGGLRCAAGACLTTCSGDDDCSPGTYCAEGSCEERLAQGTPCDARPGACQDGLSCVDGVCCNSSCGGQCESCNSDGVCTVAPRGPAPPGRMPCPGALDAECAAECDGSRRTACQYAGAATACGEASCDAGFQRFSGSGRCNGAGECLPVPENRVSCRGYACEGRECRTDCGSDAHCLTGHHCEDIAGCVADCSSNDECPSLGEVCLDGRCVSGCTPDRRAQLDGKECGAYVCNWRDGQCLDQCSSNWDCAPGNYCDGRNQCRVSPTFDGTLTGCGVRPGPAGGSPSAVLAALASLLLLAGSRRAHGRPRAQRACG